MRYKIALGLTSIVLLFFTYTVGLLQFGLVLVEYDGPFGVSQLYYLPVIQAVFVVSHILTIAFIIALVIVWKNDVVVNSKRFWILFVIAIIITVLVIGTTIFLSYETAVFDEYYADITLSDEEAIKIDSDYKEFFPYYDDLFEYVGYDFHYSYSRCEIPQATHIYIQNFSWYDGPFGVFMEGSEK